MKPLAKVALLVLMLWLLANSVQSSQAALYWFHDVRDKEISVCFAGNAASHRPDRVSEIVGHLQQFEYAVNVRFVSLAGLSLPAAISGRGGTNNVACPAPLKLPSGNDFYQGDIRVALWHTNVPVDPPGMVPGIGCTQPKVSSSWSNPPDELGLKRSCQYNLKLGDDDWDFATGTHTGTPWLNHTLHEFGHALGLAHEHARADESAHCVPATNDAYHTASAGYMTPYDKDSIMHYIWDPATVPGCVQTGSNYSNAGLTAYDKLALHILYPEDNRVAEFLGTTVIRAGEKLSLQSAWQARGANMSFVAANLRWYVDNVLVGSGPALSVTLNAPGVHTLRFEHDDFLGRHYSYTGKVNVLDEAAYQQHMAATGAAAALPLVSTLNPSIVNLPYVIMP